MFAFNAAANGGLLNVQSFTASGTYTPTPGTTKRVVYLAGATGGGCATNISGGSGAGGAGGATSFGSHVSCTGGAGGTIATASMDGVRAAADGVPTGHTGIVGHRRGGFGGSGYDGGGQWRHGQHGGGAPVVLKYIDGVATTEVVTIGSAGTATAGTSQDGMEGMAGQITVLEYS